MAKKRKCINCGSKESLTYFNGLVPFCSSCINRLDKAEGYPVLDNKPKKCPYCNTEMEGCFDGDEIFDEELAIELGLDTDNCDWEDELPYTYTYEMAACQNWECEIGFLPYGRRYYWNEEKIGYFNDKPLTPKEIKQKELEALEAAGQQRLL